MRSLAEKLMKGAIAQSVIGYTIKEWKKTPEEREDSKRIGKVAVGSRLTDIPAKYQKKLYNLFKEYILNLGVYQLVETSPLNIFGPTKGTSKHPETLVFYKQGSLRTPDEEITFSFKNMSGKLQIIAKCEILSIRAFSYAVRNQKEIEGMLDTMVKELPSFLK